MNAEQILTLHDEEAISFESKEAATNAIVAKIYEIAGLQYNGSALLREFNRSCTPLMDAAVNQGFFETMEEVKTEERIQRAIKLFLEVVKGINSEEENWFEETYIR